MKPSLVEKMRWLMLYGRPSRKLSSEEIYEKLPSLDCPVFFLSTGRVATQWYAEHFAKIKGIAAYHAPQPNLAMQSKFIYDLYQSQTSQKHATEVAKQIFITARQEYLRYAYKCEKRYFETNNNLTFFAYAIAELMPQAKFVVLYRHPKGFLSSGMKRSWYDGNKQAEYRLLRGNTETFEALSVADKILFHYCETNNFISQFCNEFSDKVVGYDLKDLNIQSLTDLHAWIGVDSRVEQKNLSAKKNQNVSTISDDPSFEFGKLAYLPPAMNAYSRLIRLFGDQCKADLIE